MKLIAKWIFVLLLATVNIVNFLYCDSWRPGVIKLFPLLYKHPSQEEYSFTILIERINGWAWDFSMVIFAVSIYLLFWNKKYTWYGIAGLLSFGGLLFQYYLFSNFYS